LAVDKSPEEAKTRGEAAASAAASASKKRRELEAKHLADLKRVLGDVGQDNGELKVGLDQNSNLILYRDIFEGEGRNRKFVRRDEVFFWVAPDGIGFKDYYGSQIIKFVKTDFKGNLEVLRQQLLDKNFLSESDYQTKNETAFNQAILDAARNHSLTQVQSYTIEGNTKFSPFKNWLGSLGSAGAGAGARNLPVQDINLMDRDVVEAIVRGVVRGKTDMTTGTEDFIQQETDRYVKQIKEGTLTTTKEAGGRIVRTTTKPFSQAQVEAEVGKKVETQLPDVMRYKQNFDFLVFLDQMGAPVV
jgi:hypothetical protein